MPNRFKQIMVTQVGHATIIRFRNLEERLWGCDVKQMHEVGQELNQLAEQDKTSMIVDFENRDFLPLAEFEGRLVVFHKRAHGRVKMCGLTHRALEVFQRNHLANVFQIYPTREEALAGST